MDLAHQVHATEVIFLGETAPWGAKRRAKQGTWARGDAPCLCGTLPCALLRAGGDEKTSAEKNKC